MDKQDVSCETGNKSFPSI